ncbi:hypothetical protein KIPB_008531 [Kipferlia bialata]|uniref:Uncharacterized protein n=1 Tax=Kipferlia bialata TaxID=797122 RepID=A0A9K3D0T3_9EUKA|nr:hypothetical protein KIPB_008531 [Kipferlia bialata]|eukprot:g8531.t1
MTTMWARVLFFNQKQHPRVSLHDLVRCSLADSCDEILRVTLMHRPNWSPKIHAQVRRCFMRLHDLNLLMLRVYRVPEGEAVPARDAMRFISLLFDKDYDSFARDRATDKETVQAPLPTDLSTFVAGGSVGYIKLEHRLQDPSRAKKENP